MSSHRRSTSVNTADDPDSQPRASHLRVVAPAPPDAASVTATSTHESRPASSFEIRRRRDSDGVVVELEGELDLATAAELERRLDELHAIKPRRILIDLRRLGFMDCTGMAVMVRANAAAMANGYRLVLGRGPDQVQRLFTLTGLAARFTFEDLPTCEP